MKMHLWQSVKGFIAIFLIANDISIAHRHLPAYLTTGVCSSVDIGVPAASLGHSDCRAIPEYGRGFGARLQPVV